MVRIAVAEHDAAVRIQLAEYIRRYARQTDGTYEVVPFADGGTLLRDYRPVYDLILLDVELPRLDGMTAARRIRAMDGDAEIVFLSSTTRYAMDGYSVGALDYLLKPVPYPSLAHQLSRAAARMQRRARFALTVPAAGGSRRVDAAAVYYIAGQGRRAHFYTVDGVFEARAALKELEAQLAGHSFMRCSPRFLVNMAQVAGMQQDRVKVGPYLLPISRPLRREFLNALANYIDGDG